MSAISPVTPAYIETGSLGRFIPEPKNSLSFTGLMRGLTGIAGKALSGASGMDPLYAELISQQIEAQQQMQIVSMVSNVEKSRHETQMAAIRNIRVG